MNFRGVFWTLAMLSALFGASMMTTSVVAVHYHTGHALQFLYSGVSVVVISLLVMYLMRPAPLRLGHREGFLIVTLAWIVLSVFGAIPFWTTRVCDSLMDGLFESVSGLTTTGATILTGLDDQPPAILFWRSMQQWFGGMGIIVLVVAVMPLLGSGGMQLFRAEVPGPVKDKLTARVAETARVLWYLYLGMTVACALAYWWGGMSGFDAINHAMSTISTGGFSTHDASFGFYASPRLHWLAALFMFLAGINFTLHFSAIHRGLSLHRYAADDEFRAYLAWLLIFIAAIGLASAGVHGSSWDAVVFNTISIATTTGFAVSDYSEWPSGAGLLLMTVMFAGACAGSTSGGVKIVRLLLLFRQAVRELRRLIHPHAVLYVKLGRRSVNNNITQALWGFAVLFGVCYGLIAILVALSGVDMLTALTASAACITNTGPGFGAVGPASNYAGLPDMAKGVLMFGMILGRLEIFTLFVLLMPEFWRR